jgi:pyrroline-5-carboxylate reductase
MIVGFLGAGHIAHALAGGWSRAGLVDPPALRFFDVDASKAAGLAAATGGDAARTAADLVLSSDTILVAVRPEQVEDVLTAVGPGLEGRTLVSVAAGVSLGRLVAALPAGSRVARVMPNVAAALGLGVFLLVPGTLGDRLDDVTALFAAAGDVIEVDEDLFDAATAVGGCMPGILARLVSAFAAAGEVQGLAPDVAARVAIGGVHGAAAIIAREGDPAAVAAAAATPGGMTAAAIQALDDAGMQRAVQSAVDAATARAKELA